MDASLVTQALNAIKSRSLDGPGITPYLERKVRIGEVLNDLAKDWTAATRSDFADAFNMDASSLSNDVADSIVSIAILNDKDLEAEILQRIRRKPQPPTLPITVELYGNRFHPALHSIRPTSFWSQSNIRIMPAPRMP